MFTKSLGSGSPDRFGYQAMRNTTAAMTTPPAKRFGIAGAQRHHGRDAQQQQRREREVVGADLQLRRLLGAEHAG